MPSPLREAAPNPFDREWRSPDWAGKYTLGDGGKVLFDGMESEEQQATGDEEPESPEPKGSPLQFHFSWRKLWRFAGPGWLSTRPPPPV